MAATVSFTIMSTPSWPSDAVDLPRIALHAGTDAGFLAQPLAAHQRRIDGQHQRRIGEAGMLADLLGAEAARLERLHIGRFGRAIIGRDEVRVRGGAEPGAVELVGDLLQLLLIAAVIADQHDLRETRLPQAARRAIEGAPEGRDRDRDRAGKAHMLRRRRDIALGT